MLQIRNVKMNDDFSSCPFAFLIITVLCLSQPTFIRYPVHSANMYLYYQLHLLNVRFCYNHCITLEHQTQNELAQK